MNSDPGGTFALVMFLSLFVALAVVAFWRQILITLVIVCLAVVFAPIVMAVIELQNLRGSY